MRVVYSLRSRDLNAVAAEAAWAESMGYDGVSTNETAHDPFLPLAVAGDIDQSRDPGNTRGNRFSALSHGGWPTRRETSRTTAAGGSASVWGRR